jgi:tRNA pseudouridine55 synthase
MDPQTDPAILVIDKVVGPTSRDAVDIVEDNLAPQKAGHGGTLDPEARGVLPILLNGATRLMEFLHDTPKTYAVSIRFDRASETFDREGDIRQLDSPGPIKKEQFRQFLGEFTGQIKQVPPRFAALKQDGKTLYERTRAGEDVDPEARSVVVHGASIIAFEWPRVSIEIECGKGFYIRSLVRDLIAKLDLSGALITELKRTEYGPYSQTDAAKLDSPEAWSDAVEPPQTLLKSFPRIECSGEQKRLITHGSWIEREENQQEADWAVAISPEGQLLALMKPASRDGAPYWWPNKVFVSN